MIKNLTPSLPEVGKIKIGFKGGEITSKFGKKFQPPKKLDHFIITGLERGADGNFLKNADIHEKVGEKPIELDIRLLYDDPNLNFLTRYVCYDGTTLWCTGDGEAASRIIKRGENENNERKQVSCPCERIDRGFSGKGKCKPSGVLSVMLDNSPMVGGVHKLRTTSFNSVTNILSSMAMISRITGGVLAGIPLKLTFGKKTTTVPGTEQQTTIPIIGLVYKGSVRELAESGQRTALEFAGYRKRIEYIEDIARKQLDKEMGLGLYTEAETDEDIVAEFYPEQVGATGPDQPETNKNGTSKSFEDLIDESVSDSNLLPYVDKYIKLSAKAAGKTEDEIKTMFTNDFEDSLENFMKWAVKQGAAPGQTSAKTPTTVKSDGSSSAETQKTATFEKAQGPQPPSAWDPYTAGPRARYGKDKAKILIAELNKKGIIFTSSMTGKELHLLLTENVMEELAETKEESQPDQDTPNKVAHTDDDWDENAPQKMAGESTQAASKEYVRQRYIAMLKTIDGADRSVWTKSKQQVGIMSTPNLETMPIEKLTEWATLAQSMMEA